MQFKSDFLAFLNERGFLHQCSSYENLDDIMSKEKITAYIGFDCTANSLHVGSLMQILLLKYLQKFGHTPIALLGAGTTMIGDPSGRDESRKMLTVEQINENMLGIKAVLERFISFDGSNAGLLLNNADWLSKFSYLEFLRDFGVHFTVNRMLSFDSVKLRLEKENPMTFLEFNYMLLQAVDYLHLNQNHNVKLQLGGSDQWGNIINGVELIRRKDAKEVFALTTNLLTKSDGSKMGKTASGAVWLTPSMFSVWDFYQYFRNVDDLDVIKYLKIFTEIPMAEIGKLATLQGKELNEAKKLLAFEITKLCHGELEAKSAEELAINTFEKGIVDANLPTFFITSAELNDGLNIVDALIKFGLTASKGETRKLILNAGVKLNDAPVVDSNYSLSKVDIKDDVIKLSLGKKKHILLKIEG